MFDKNEFIKKNILEKKPFLKEGLFITELTIKEQNKIQSELIKNGVSSKEDESKIIVNIDDFNSSIYLRVSYGLIDEKGNKVFTKEEIENLKDNDFVEKANEAILEFNKPKK